MSKISNSLVICVFVITNYTRKYTRYTLQTARSVCQHLFLQILLIYCLLRISHFPKKKYRQTIIRFAHGRWRRQILCAQWVVKYFWVCCDTWITNVHTFATFWNYIFRYFLSLSVSFSSRKKKEQVKKKCELKKCYRHVGNSVQMSKALLDLNDTINQFVFMKTADSWTLKSRLIENKIKCSTNIRPFRSQENRSKSSQRRCSLSAAPSSRIISCDLFFSPVSNNKLMTINQHVTYDNDLHHNHYLIHEQILAHFVCAIIHNVINGSKHIHDMFVNCEFMTWPMNGGTMEKRNDFSIRVNSHLWLLSRL